MKKLYLIFLWHMHQPLYKNPKSGYYELPWVLLRSLKDYFDMPYYLRKFKRVKVNFNLTPVLLEQIEDYAESKAKDELLELVLKPRLNKKEKEFLRTLFESLPEPMINSVEGLKRLKEKGNLEEEDYKDLRVLYLLAWCGNYLRESSEVVKRLLKKGGNYEKSDRVALLEEILKHLRSIIPLYKELFEEKRIGLSTTPYYHPITPILLDAEDVKASEPYLKVPNIDAVFEEDAREQVALALEKFEKTFGVKPKHFWPSEGALSEKTLKLFLEFGIELTATDENLLFKSYPQGNKFKVYNYKGLKVLFRDRGLSDAISFIYYSWKEEDGVKDFIKNLRNIYEYYDFSPVVSVILDGENPWDYYRENGRRFLELLYQSLEENDWIETLTLDEVSNLETTPLEHLKAGTWTGSFSKWIGSDEKNQYWEKLAGVKKEVGKSEWLLVAEGSDWFWWAGELKGVFGEVFEKLFYSFLEVAKNGA